MNITEPFLPFQFTIQVCIEERNLDYLLTVDESGQVYEAIPMVFELSSNAQKIVLGKTDGQLERKIWAYSRLFKYLLPMVLAGKLPAYQKQMAPLVDEIQRRLAEGGMSWQDLPIAELHNSLALNICTIFLNPTEVDATEKELWEKIAYIIQHLENKPTKVLYELKRTHSLTVAHFVIAIIPFFEGYAQTGTFEYLAYTKSETIKRYLLNELGNTSFERYAGGILRGLEVYQPGGEDIYNAVIAFYQRTDKKRDDGYHLVKVLDVLEHYRTPRVREIALEILRSCHHHAAPFAAEMLLKTGTDEEEIVQVMMPFFKAANPNISRVAFTIFEQYITKEYLPSASETLDIFITTLSKGTNSTISVCMIGIAIKTGAHLLIDRLFGALNHEVPTVREGMLFLINRLHEENQVDFRPFMSTQMTDRYWALVNDNNIEISKNAICIIGKIGHAQKKEDYINLLLDLISRNTKNAPLVVEGMNAINAILPSIPYPFQIESFYLAILNDDHYQSSVAALKGLRFSPNKKLKNLLWLKYKDDRTNSVSNAAKDLLNVPRKF